MRGPWIGLVLWAVTLGAAYWLGAEGTTRTSGPAAGHAEADVTALKAENERLRRALEDRGPVLESAASGPPAESGDERGEDPARGPLEAAAPGEQPVARLDIQSAESADELLARFFDYVRAMLAKGEAGHLELLQTFDDMLFGSKENQQRLQQLFGGDDEAARYIYPLVRFMVANEAGVVALTETTFKTMAENPSKFADFDNDTLEVFTEGIAFVLPGAISEERLDTFRGYAKKILETPEAQQPESVVKNRRRIERVMRIWAPRLTPEEAVARLRAGDITPQEAAALLGRLPPDMLGDIDIARWLGPLVQRGDYRSIAALGRLRLSPAQQAQFDRHVLVGAAEGTFSDWTVRHYLANTGRGEWAAARDLIEQGLNQGGRAMEVFAKSVLRLPKAQRPDADWVRWVIETYSLSTGTRNQLKSHFGIQ